MDMNLQKIIDYNMHLIIRGNPSTALIQGKSYLTNVLGEDRYHEINIEFEGFKQLVLRHLPENQEKFFDKVNGEPVKKGKLITIRGDKR